MLIDIIITFFTAIRHSQTEDEDREEEEESNDRRSARVAAIEK